MIIETKKYNIGNEIEITVEYNEQGIARISKPLIEDYLIPKLLKAEKYKWHDLRKDPNDLPKLEYCKQVVVVDCEHKAKVVYVSTLLSWRNEFFIAWKYEPFEEVEE